MAFGLVFVACSGQKTEPHGTGSGGAGNSGSPGTSAGAPAVAGSMSAGGVSGGGTAGSGTSGSSAAGGAAGTGTGGAGGGAGAGPRAVLTDDFESATPGGPPDASKWTVDLFNGSGTVAIDGSVAHLGQHSLHVNANNSFHTMAMLKGAPLFPAPGNKLFGRVYVHLASMMPTGHVIWVEAGTIVNDQIETRIGANLGMLDINKWPGDTEQRAPASTLSAGTWQCLEFMFDGGGSEARVWLDTAELTDLHVTNWVAPNQANGNNQTPILNWGPSYEAIRFGWELGNGEIWFDDLALGYDKLGCL